MPKYLLLLFTILSLNAIGQNSFDWCFVENKGQFNNQVRFRHTVPNGVLFLTKTGITYHLSENKGHSHSNEPITVQKHAFSVDFKGANADITIEKNDPTKHYFNYFMSDNEAEWQSKVKGFGKVKYTDIYDKIDFVMYDDNQQLKYDFIVKKGGNANDIQLQYNDLTNLFIDANGRLHLENAVSTIIEDAPYVYQIINDKKIEVSAEYVLAHNTISFLFPNGYNDDYDLVIDPTLIMSTYSGSSELYSTNCTAYDNAGNLYVAGGNLFGNFPATAGAYQTIYQGPGENVAIQKFDQTGTLLFATYYGGSGSYPLDMAINNNQNLVILMATRGGLPTNAASHQQNLVGGTDYGIGVITPDGANALQATYLGGTGDEAFGAAVSDNAAGLFIAANNNILVCGGTESTDFPVTAGAFQGALSGVSDGIVASFNGALNTLNWATYLGGNGAENANSVAIAPNANVYVVGNTNSPDFPTTAGAVNPAPIGARDGFVTELAANGSAVIASTYLGTAQNDRAKFILINNLDEVFVGGSTNGIYPVSPGSFASQSANNLFVHKLNSLLNTTLFSTGVGCNATQQPEIFMTAFGIDNCEKIYFTGASTGNNFPTTPNAFTAAEKGLYMCVLEPNAVALNYGTYFGGNVNGQHFHPGSKSKYNNDGVLFHTECTQATDYTILGGIGSLLTTPAFDGASFIFDFEFDKPITQTNIPAPTGCDFPVTLDASHPDNENVFYLWSTGETTPTIDVITNGEYKVEVYNFCDTIRDSVDVNLNGATADFVVDRNSACERAVFEFTDISTNAAADASYLWDFGDGDSSNLVNPTHQYNVAGVYSVELTITANGCVASEVKTDIINILPNPKANFSFSPTDIDIQNTEVTFTSISSNDVTTRLWSFFVNNETRDSESPTFTFPDEASGTYPVKLKVENINECVDSITKLIEIRDVITFHIPNIFTPGNGDLNEIFRPVVASGIDPYQFRMLIFNRYGEVVFESRNYDRGWDGTFNNTLVQQGAYVWQIDFKAENGSEDFTYRGHVTVLR